MKNKEKIILILILIIAFSFFLYQLNSTNIYFNTPDEAVQKLYSDIYRETGKMYFNVDNSIFNSFARLRGTYIINEKIVTLKFIGFPFLVGSLSRGLEQISFFLTPLMATLILLLVFLISLELFENKKEAIFSVIILLFLPFFWYWANKPLFGNIPSLFFFFAGYLFFIKIMKNKNKKANYILMAIFFALSVAIRYDSLIFIFCMCLPAIFRIKKLNIKYILLSIIIFLLVLSPIFLISADIYGNPFIYGQKILSDNSLEKIPKLFSNVLLNFENIFLFFPFLIFIIIPFFNIFNSNQKIQKIILFGLLLYIVIFSYIFLSEFPPTHTNALHESFTRYFLGFYIFSSIYLGKFISSLKNKKILSLFLLVIISFSILSTIPIIEWQWKSMEINKQITEEILLITPESSYILLSGSDKFIYPLRKTIPINHFKNEDNSIDYRLTIDTLIEIDQIYSVFVYSRYLDIDLITLELNKKNYGLEVIDTKIYLYKLTKNDPKN